jgi:solute:Na+ symporter, SSS family
MLQTADYVVMASYIAGIIAISVLYRTSSFRQIFAERIKIPWWLAGISLMMIPITANTPLMESGIIYREGLSGMWLIWCGLIAAGVLPVMFAPLWPKMNFITDNQFLLMRFSGKGAIVLHKFRAIYIGLLVTPFLLSFLTLSFSKIAEYYFVISKTNAIYLTGFLLILASLRNSFRQKLRTDIFNALLLFAVLFCSIYFITGAAGNLLTVSENLKTAYPDKIDLFADFSLNSSAFYSMMVLFLVQWWSVSIMDGAGPEAQRFINTRGGFNAFKAGIFPVIVYIFFTFLITYINLAGLSLFGDSIATDPALNKDPESIFVHTFSHYLPAGLRGLSLVALFAAFITTAEGFLNWGTSFLVVDYYKTYQNPDKKDAHYIRLSMMLMVVISLFALVISLFSDRLDVLMKILFSISAGVGPVFVLRWFWWRINAWSQFTAMLASFVYTVLFEFGYDYMPGIAQVIDAGADICRLDLYPFKILILTILVTATWLMVTFMTKADDYHHIKKYAEQVKPGGIWPPGIDAGKGNFGRKILLALIVGVVNVLLITGGWVMMFYHFWGGIFLIGFCLIMIYLVIRNYERTVIIDQDYVLNNNKGS